MRCPLCRAPSELVATHREREVFLCGVCDLAFLHPRHHVTDTDARAEYLLHDNTMECEGYVRMFEEKIATVEERCEGISSVLDFGCGPGPVLVELLRRRGYEAVGYDPMFFPAADLDRTYDCVISTEVFEHFTDPASELVNVGRLVRTGGYLAVMTLLHGEGCDFSKWWYLNMPSHVVYYSARTFTWIAGEHGYDVIYSDDTRFVILRKSDAV
jgi:SAM-dependent methyltransferase